jgi:virulence-associated protein VagC
MIFRLEVEKVRSKVTEEGVLIPKRLLQGIDEVDIRKEDGAILVVPVTGADPIFELGKQPISDDLTDASEKHDLYLYGRE